MELSLPLLRPSCPPTRNNSHATGRCSSHQRGNITVLSLIWFALTVVGCVAIVRATHTTLLRGHAQGVADAIALAYADHGATSAEQLAEALGVSISSASKNPGGFITVVVRADNFSATSSAG
jgi:hypothetical protein